jgi:hypothetical protein
VTEEARLREAGVDADELELLLEPLRHAFDHVGDQSAGQTMKRLVKVLIRRTLHEDLIVLERHLHSRMQHAIELALRAFHVNLVSFDRRGDALGERYRVLSNS